MIRAIPLSKAFIVVASLLLTASDGSADPHLPPSATSSAVRNMAVGTLLVLPSVVYSDEFVSSLVVLNMETEPNNVLVSATGSGESIGSLTIELGVGQRFRSTNILQHLGAPPGSSGTILLRSTNNRLLSAVSEVSSSRGTAGFLPVVNFEAAWTQGFLLEAIDSGPRGMPGTYRTNLGLITDFYGNPADVTMTLFNSLGQQVGNPFTIRAPEQINTIVERLRGSSGVTEGYVKISSAQAIIAWASKIENGTEDPSFQIGVGAASSGQQQIRRDVGTRLLIPSSSYSETFTTSLVVLNMDTQPNDVTITAYDSSGNHLAPPFPTTLPVGGQFRSSNILQQLGAAFGSFGPIKVESTSNRLLSAVSEVKTFKGFAGFFPAVNVQTAWTEGFILEVMDSGPRGTPATYRANLGLSSVGSGTANVSITLFNDTGRQVGNSISTTVASNGLTQLDSIAQRLDGSAAISGGYLRIVSSQPIIAWASKVENGTDDPSFQIGIGVLSLGMPVDLNGTYLAPSSSATFMDAIASVTTHPLGDRRGEGQVYELNKGLPAVEGTYTPFSDDGRKPQALNGVDLRGKSFQCEVDLHDLNLWNAAGGAGAEFFQIGAGRQADSSDTGTEEVFVFIYRSWSGFALYMETDWFLYRPATTYYAAADETKFRLRVDVNAAGTEALLTIIPLNGMAAGTVHTVSPLPLDATNDNVTSTSFFAGFTQNFDNIKSTAKATISSFVTNAVANTADDR